MIWNRNGTNLLFSFLVVIMGSSSSANDNIVTLQAVHVVLQIYLV